MCRSIKRLRYADQQPTEDELRAAALQFVRKISGFRQPSKSNQEVFETAVEDVTLAAARLLQALPPLKASPTAG
jgi:hypothetical protein